MRRAVHLAAAAILLGELAGLATLEAQSRLRAALGAEAGFVSALGDARASYGGGLSAGAGLSLTWGDNPWQLRVDGTYAHLQGGGAAAGFPALNLLGFGFTAMRRLGSPARAIAPYLLAGLGPWNLQDALPYAAWRTGLGMWAGFGALAGRGRLGAFAEARLQRVTGNPPTDLARVDVGLRWSP